MNRLKKFLKYYKCIFYILGGVAFLYLLYIGVYILSIW